jgi:hypothetical protein
MGLKFNDIDLKTNYNFVVTEVQGRGSPPVSRTVLDHPLVHGDIELNAKLRSRDIVIRGYVYGSDLATKKDSLIKLITQAYETECKLTFPDTNRSIYVKLAGEPIVIGPIGPVLNAQAYEITFRFTAQDPYFYGEDHDEVGFNIVKVNANAPTYLISPRRKFLKREPSIKIEPYTVVNLLGKYGDFETDSNGDGVADGWTVDFAGKPTLVTSFDGGKAQYFSFTNTGRTYVNLRKNISSNPDYFLNRTFFIKGYAKPSYGGTATGNEVLPRRLTVYGAGSSGWVKSFSLIFDWNTWSCKYMTFKFTNTDIKIVNMELFYVGHPSNPVDAFFEATVDKIMLVDLTVMGALPSGLQAFFSSAGITKWEELATPINITGADGRTQSGNAWLAELIPYVDSVASFGFVWQ